MDEIRMNAWDRVQYCSDLRKFSDLIQSIDDVSVLGNSIGSLYSVAQKFQYGDDDIIESPELVFDIKKKIGGTLPADVEALTVHFSFRCEFDRSVDISENDPIKEYSFDIEIIGKTKNEIDPKNYWHLDKDIAPEDGGEHRFDHPLYHFQSGGYGMDKIRSTGDILVLSAPRIPHPPMDIFLGVHFILCNFINRKDFPFIYKLFDDIDYQDILKRARKRMFAPYFSAFSSYAADKEHRDFTIDRVFPVAFDN
ncbi:hypothetical protein [uncultured Amphritea sp.]|uniref:hypothetical protein n=1 Tax=uncultured Amphritea sp. TaxID=981605 RepID=UPI0025F4DA7E|nr:hypothetical protein [uncultured Amphritea sp.]